MDSKTVGLLFYASGKQFAAEYAAGEKEPTFCKDVVLANEGFFQCGDYQKLAWKAPHHMYARKGTLSFFWRSRYPLGPTEFPLFRVGFADHTSWDQSWLRIDWAGYGFDAMITDRNLKRARVSVEVPSIPKADQWVHLALTWDQRYGIRFYIDGMFAGEKFRPEIYDCGLDQFGPHGRAISNWNVSNDYNFIRGGDIKEICVFDRMLDDSDIIRLSHCQDPAGTPFSSPKMVDELEIWKWQNGLRGQLPSLPALASVRKVEIHDAYDLKRWYWKACDGIRETTWPGVYNRSRLEGRNDYFQLPDWDCYALSGKEISFVMPEEPFNWIEIAGSAHGVLTWVDSTSSSRQETKLFHRAPGEERTIHEFAPLSGGELKFTNEEREEPIGDFTVLHLSCGEAPQRDIRQSFVFSPVGPRDTMLSEFISGRYLADQIAVLQGTKEDKGGKSLQKSRYFQLVVPYDYDPKLGLDGVEVEWPGDGIACNLSIQIKDPLWNYRNLLQMTFRKLPGAQRIWFDTRDRILPEGKSLLMTVASDESLSLDGWKVSLRFKPAEEAKKEHCIDRFTQVRDVYGHLVEEAPKGKLFNMYNRFVGDINDLMKVDPKHIPGQYYLYERDLLDHGRTKFPGVRKPITNPETYFRPEYDLGKVPKNIPDWAWWQVQYLKRYKYVVNWYIDHRQIDNGEFGGGLSDDGDFTSDWVGLALMGCNPEKIIDSVERLNDAFYHQGMITNGLCSIQADELHSSEEGLTCLAQCCAADYGNPKYLERAMENARGGFWITGINKAGHRHFKSSYFSASRYAPEHPWDVQQAFSGIVLSPAWFVARFSHDRKVMQLLTELADGMVAHYDVDAHVLKSVIKFETDESSEEFSDGAYTEKQYQNRSRGNLFTLYPAYALTGDSRYFEVIDDKFKGVDVCYVDRANTYEPESATHIDKQKVAAEYKERTYHAAVREYYNTLGSPWIDRVEIRYQEVQYDRLAGIGYERRYVAYPRNMVSWRFMNESDDEALAILSPVALRNLIKLIICNISDHDVEADLLGSEMSPGIWEYRLGTDETDSDSIENLLQEGEVEWKRMTPIHLVIPKAKTCVFIAKLKAAMPWKAQCDLGISKADLRLYSHGLNVRIHSLGMLDTPEDVPIVLKDPDGKVVLKQFIPSLPAPSDLRPKCWDIVFNTWQYPDLRGFTVEIDPEGCADEITRWNNQVTIDARLWTRLVDGSEASRHIPV